MPKSDNYFQAQAGKGVNRRNAAGSRVGRDQPQHCRLMDAAGGARPSVRAVMANQDARVAKSSAARWDRRG